MSLKYDAQGILKRFSSSDKIQHLWDEKSLSKLPVNLIADNIQVFAYKWPIGLDLSNYKKVLLGLRMIYLETFASFLHCNWNKTPDSVRRIFPDPDTDPRLKRRKVYKWGYSIITNNLLFVDLTITSTKQCMKRL